MSVVRIPLHANECEVEDAEFVGRADELSSSSVKQVQKKKRLE